MQQNVTFIIFIVIILWYYFNMVIGILLGLVAIGVAVWLIIRNVRPSGSRHRIQGATCPKCGSDKVFWAGYSDRRECAKCGKIFS
jgi:ribosomal protein S27AE